MPLYADVIFFWSTGLALILKFIRRFQNIFSGVGAGP